MAEVRSPRLGPRGLALIASVALAETVLRYALARLRAERDDAVREAVHDALHDPLTGLPNRRAADQHLRVPQVGTALAVVDLDGFKQVNDAHSHVVGDRALIAVAASLRGSLRATDLLARTGGDEFVAVLPATPLAEAETVLHRAVAAVAALPAHVGRGVTVSVGVTASTAGTPADALARADAAMYRAKRGGGNGVVVDRSPHPTPEPAASSLVSRLIDDSGMGAQSGRLRVS